ncbi:MAG: endo alpha-1,4 polygalactosaminidase [Oleiphilaceae bacterium]|nr:endo alpha-1,4 polygalactosaminidase [Oleiphilaceae bacterium]
MKRFLTGVLFIILLLGQAALGATPRNIGFYYGHEAPIGRLMAYDWLVLQQDQASDARVSLLEASGTLPLSYISMGEMALSHRYYDEIQPHWVIASNPDWGSVVLDLRLPAVRAFLLERLIAPAMERGFRGIFLDTLDSYQLSEAGRENPEAFARSQHQLLESIRARYPRGKILINRGFHLPRESEELVDGLAFESYRMGYDAGRDRYRTLPDQDRRWLDGQLARWRESRPDMPIIAIDYVADPSSAPALAEQLRRDGFVPYVSDPALQRLGPTVPAVVKRHVLVLTDVPQQTLDLSLAHRQGGMVLERLGLVPEYHSTAGALPREPTADRYAGILVWPERDTLEGSQCRWLREQQQAGVPVAFMGRMPRVPACLALLATSAASVPAPPLAADPKHPSVTRFEGGRLPSVATAPLAEADGQHRPWLTLSGSDGTDYSPVYSHGGGGVALAPYLFEPGPGDTSHWLFDPFAFLRQAFVLDDFPMIDSTTESGRRILTAHIDGDAIVSRGEFPGSPLSARVFIERILNRYPLPRTISVIEGETSPQGLFPEVSEEAEALARTLFRHPGVEVASHTYSHPFYWRALASGDGPDLESTLYGYFLPIPGYQGSLEREIQGSVDYINERLAPADKPVAVFLWSGDARPGKEALRRVREAGLVNVNGGVTAPLPYGSGLTDVWPDARPVGDELQVYAPVMNENVYTGNWTGPFYGYRNAIDTFRLLEAMGRLKPLGIYYHFYSATKPESLAALEQVYQYALAQPVTPLHLSDYARRVQSQYRSALLRDESGAFTWRGEFSPRTVRIPRDRYPDLENSTGVAGFHDAAGNRYVHLLGDQPRLVMQAQPPQGPWLDQANAVVSHWQRQPQAGQWRITVGLEGHQPLQLSIAGTRRCKAINAPGATLSVVNDRVDVTLPQQRVSQLTLECR